MADPTIRMPGCPNCGTPSSPDESFCRNCGKRLVAPTVAAPPPSVNQPRQGVHSQSTVTAVAPNVGQMGGGQMPGQQYQSGPPINVGRKKRSPLLLGCLVFLGIIVAVIAAGGIYIWRSTIYTPPNREAPATPERAAGTMTEFPVDNDPNAPATPTSVQTEALGGTLTKSTSDTQAAAKLPPGVDRTKLAKGATSMTSATYKPKPKGSTTTPTSGSNINIFVLNTMPNQQNFGNGLTTSIVDATDGTQTGVRVQSPNGATYVGSKIKTSSGSIYVLNKQSGDICILIYSDDPANQQVVDRLAQNVGNGQGLLDYPEVKDSLWTLPASTPSGLTLVEITTMSGAQIEREIARSSGGGDEVQKVLTEFRSFIPDKLTGARYVDANKREWVSLNFEYPSSFSAWKTWLLARSALGLGGAQSVNVREVGGLYLDQNGSKLLMFQKGPYLIFLSVPSGGSQDQLVALGNLFQV